MAGLNPQKSPKNDPFLRIPPTVPLSLIQHLRRPKSPSSKLSPRKSLCLLQPRPSNALKSPRELSANHSISPKAAQVRRLFAERFNSVLDCALEKMETTTKSLRTTLVRDIEAKRARWLFAMRSLQGRQKAAFPVASRAKLPHISPR